MSANKVNEVLIKITHTGLCGTDIHAIGCNSVLGHEGIGIVEAIGSEVTQLEIGDRVGGGFLRNSCGHCKYCLNGQDMWCYDRDIFMESDGSRQNGTLADYYVGIETYVYKIPRVISNEHATPLQCTRATVYSTLIESVNPGQRVGIVGIGGLGHLAIQFAAKMGADVAVFSSTAAKEEEARRFGASEFCLLQEPGSINKPVDVLVIAGSAYPEWEKFLDKKVLARNGIVIPLSAPDSMNLPGGPMLFNGYTMKMSLVATRKVHRDMLEFAALHSIKPTVETFELSDSGVAAALNKLKAGTMRYRGVLVAA
ncbi:hypothetical protein TRIATDRAFT_94020 [Trichoderma atroviride IMI 206040]|uniref:Enoyl reductase (ER) domain-containing protein n=1 Tax=Hypocrea atroviridis (strain ATCC 20476 / IMI 206040) TaxID=452589 RepID=G9NKZ5_HYPAI|nr:uncharacterized protein TRIATDRAFT_94020 [Trichoderma atroviride IMI 206040]EHK48564.1 hypothetical protein TRIATDRAFT_94020 [Trichoderma atroviride IMI 206040]